MYAARQDNFLGMDPSMKGPFAVSGVFHLAAFLFATLGLPYVIKPPEITTPISIEIVEMDKITQTNRVSRPDKSKKPEEKPPPAPRKPQPPKMTAEAPPDLTPKASPVPMPEKIKKPDEKKLKPPKPEKIQEMKKDTSEDFSSLLKNLTDAKPDAQEAPDTEKESTSVPMSAIAPIGDKLTMSEVDALRRQLGQCWNVLSGAKYAENLMVEIRLQVNPDRTIRQATIVNQLRYNTDSVFRAAADAAMRALRNPLCTPLALPPEKYNEWKDTKVSFNPKDML